MSATLDRIGRRDARVVDVGTGSGAVAVAIAKAAPKACDQAAVIIQLHRRVLAATGDDLTVLRDRIERLSPITQALPQLVAASGFA